MAIRIECSACNTIMQVADALQGKRVRCKSCGGAVTVAEAPVVAELTQGIADKNRMPPAPPKRRRVVDDEDAEDRSRPRRRRREESSANLLPLWIAGGGGVVVLLVIVIILVARSGSTPAPNPNAPQPVAQNQPMVQNQQPVAQNQPPVVQQQQPVNVPAPPPDRRNAPPLIPDPPAGETMKGEQIYQRLLQSTVWIVADHRIVAANNNRPFAQPFGPPDFPRPKFPKTKLPRPPFGPGAPGGPGGPVIPGGPPLPGNNMPLLPQPGQTSNLSGSTWDGSETLPGFGRLRFQFVGNIQVIMIDAKETMRGSFVHTGNIVTLTFGGGVVYNGIINGNSMSGSASNGRTNWTWSVTRGGGAGPGPMPANPNPGGIVTKMTGSGSFIDRKHRLIITNVHVVGKNDNVTIYFPDYDAQGELIVRSDVYKQKAGYPARVVMREDRADLALVQMQNLPEGVQPLTVARTKVKQAQQVHSVGNPGASRALWVYSPGKVRTVLKDQWKIFDDIDGRNHHYDAMKIETDSAINPGDSGGPLVDDRCALVGVAHGGSLVANNFSFFIEASEVRQVLERYYRAVNDKLTQRAEPDGRQVAAAN
ncbi:MAG: trypsin-like peptidase domain-containing protein [Gemmataceae bacterium]|nr:trypsin-like peptidase domain-containing protein [Gemmataceae bacterium]